MEIVEFDQTVDQSSRRVEGKWAIYPNCLMFRAGDYPDKGFGITKEELWREAGRPGTIGGNIEHTSFLRGRACEVRKKWIDPNDPSTLRGEIAVALALDELMHDHERKLSCEFDRNGKALTGIALTINPRVSDAALMSAYAAFSADQGETIEAAPAKGKLMSLKDKFLALFQQAGVEAPTPEELDKLESASVAEFSTVQAEPLLLTANPDAEARIAELNRQLADSQTQVAEFSRKEAEAKAASAKADAEAWFEAEVKASRAYPAEKEFAVAQFTRARADDASAPQIVTFAEGGEAHSRVDVLKASFAARSAHQMTQEVLADAAARGDMAVLMHRQTADNPAEAADKEPDAARKEALLKLSALGLETLKEIK